MLDRIQVIIPAFDEEATIGGVVRALRAVGLERIRVVDNGSRDRTAARATEAGAEVIAEPRPGYGQACWTGYQSLADVVEWVLFCDADGSDDIAVDVPRLIAAAQGARPHDETAPSEKTDLGSPPTCNVIRYKFVDQFAGEEVAGVDFVLGDRRARAGSRAVMTPVQHFGNGLATSLIRLGWGRSYGDLGPLRMIRRELLERVGMEDRGFGWTIEMQVRAVEVGARIVELPVGYQRRKGGRSKISGTIKGSVQAGTIILGTLAKLGWRRARAGTDGWSWISGLLLLLGAVGMAPWGDFAQPGMVRFFLAAAAVMGVGYLATSRVQRIGAGWFWLIAVGARVALLPMNPGDDVWRYVWEGRMQFAGFSPYLHAPFDPLLATWRDTNWGLINHPEHSTIYPPLTQWVFHLVAAVGGGVIGLKAVFVAAELGATALLVRRFGRGATLVYAWNPLVIYSGAGGAHMESLFGLTLVAAWMAWERAEQGAWRAYLWVGVSVGLKWVSAPVAAWMAWRVRASWRRALLGLGLAVLPVGAGLLWFDWRYGRVGPLMPAEFVEVARGMDVVPWLVAQVLPESYFSNGWIVLAFAPFAAWVFFRARRWEGFVEGYLVMLLLFSPSNHAWYFTWLMPLAVATRNTGSRWLAVSGFAYFWVWDGVAQGQGWEQTTTQRAVVWLPFLAGWAWTRWKERHA